MSTVTVKGQVTLPKAVRDAAGIKPGDQVKVRATTRGVLIEKTQPANDYGAKLDAIAARRLIIGETTDEIMRELRGDPDEDYR